MLSGRVSLISRSKVNLSLFPGAASKSTIPAIVPSTPAYIHFDASFRLIERISSSPELIIAAPAPVSTDQPAASPMTAAKGAGIEKQ